MSTLRSSVRLTFVLAIPVALALPVQGQVEMPRLAGMTARSIGPAGMSGRVAAVDVVVADPDIIYVGAATGGVWKSTSGGVSWEPIFDDQPVAAIGAIAIYQASPDIVWVGTGEANPRNSVSVGNGVYRSLDGGRTWKHLGLEGSERISRILLHPSDSNVAWVAAMGQAWGENEERGVYKTTDGGETWDRVLYVDERTGAADLVIDPRNPNKLIASMWEYRRWPFFFKSGGPGSGAWITYDGGDAWKLISDGDNWPEGELGRIGIEIAPSDSNVVYALVEAEKSALLRSSDGGASWRAVNTETDVSPRPFYYADLVVDSAWPNRVYRVAGNLDVSDDGGKSFRSLIGFFQVHGDYHAFWVHPQDPTYIVAGNDGGLAISRDRGETWRPVQNLPLAQYYHVAVDNDVPYNVYGGLQDNGSWRGPSAVWSGGFFQPGHSKP